MSEVNRNVDAFRRPETIGRPVTVGFAFKQRDACPGDLSTRKASDYLPPQLKAQLVAEGKLLPDGTLAPAPPGAAGPPEPRGPWLSLGRWLRKLFF